MTSILKTTVFGWDPLSWKFAFYLFHVFFAVVTYRETSCFIKVYKSWSTAKLVPRLQGCDGLFWFLRRYQFLEEAFQNHKCLIETNMAKLHEKNSFVHHSLSQVQHRWGPACCSDWQQRDRRLFTAEVSVSLQVKGAEWDAQEGGARDQNRRFYTY